jgi:FkbH-like protein
MASLVARASGGRTEFLGTLASHGGAVVGPVHRADEQMLIAFAALDPGGATAWIVEQLPADVAETPRRRLARFLAALADSLARSPDAVPPRTLVALLARYGDLLTAEAAAELSSLARTGAVDPVLDEALRGALERAPANGGLLRPAAELAAAVGDHGRAHDLLTRLGRASGDLATVQYVYHARGKLIRADMPRVRIALLSSFTIDQLVPHVDLACRGVRLDPEFYVAPFNSWERETFGEGSALQQFDPQIAFLAVAADDLVPQLATHGDADLPSIGAAAVDRLLAAAERFTTWSSAILIVHGLHSTFRDPLGPAAGRDGPSRGEILSELNTRLAEGLRAMPRAYYLDLPDLLTRRRQGAGGVDNPKMRHLAAMRLSEHVLGDLAATYTHYIAPLKGRTRKCIVLDLDNTLWGGIVGEDGPHGIRLGLTAPGSEYREFQQYLLGLTRRGFLLAINSKNNDADALEVIRSHEAMVLREDAFSAMRINWESKANNILAIADELSIGLDSLVFIDDNEKERALMRHAHPDVLTPEMPRDPARYRETLESLPELQVLSVTDEDRSRTRQYVERRQRETLRVTAQTHAEYLESLHIEAEIGLVSDRTTTRVHQLFQRTNQFNLTGVRYDPGTLAARATAPEWRIYTTSVKDKFGDHGLVASAVVHVESNAWTIENLVMSCRVIGYGVEDALLAQIALDAAAAGASWLDGDFIASKKNAPARDFYSRSSFTQHVATSEKEHWRREIDSGDTMMPAWITARTSHGA